MNREEKIEDNRFYHVYNRGNDRDRIFGDDSDFRAFIAKMGSLAMTYHVEVPVYALMPNHYHLLALQHPGGDLSKMMGALATSAAKRYNLKYAHVGHLFQGPFRYKLVAEENLWYVASYIHLNPVRARMVERPQAWKFSNYAEDFLQPGKNKGEGNLLRGIWEGYAGYVAGLLEDSGVNENWKRKIRVHVREFVDEVC